MNKLFSYSHYPKYLRDLTQEESSAMTVSELARIAQVQRPYMSNVLAERAQLNLEQAFRITRALQFDDEEQAYFMNLVEIERAAGAEYKMHLQERNDALKKASNKLENKLKRTVAALDLQMMSEYFSTWEYAAIHILVSIPEYQTVQNIAEVLNLSAGQVAPYLNKLIQWQLVEKKGTNYKWLSGDVHLPAKSSLVYLHHRNWRDRALEHSKRNPEKGVHFTSVYSISKKDYEKFKGMILDFLKQYNGDAVKSKEEQLVCFNVDFFSI
ncbi:MAG: TIGR02147 family protein [Bdellovibrio sp.]